MSTTNNLLRLDRLELRNFRCFAECVIEPHSQLTVLVAENGRGKTAVLDAVRDALALFVDTLTNTIPLHGFVRTDSHLIRNDENQMIPILPTQFIADGVIAGEILQWSRSLSVIQGRTSTKDARALINAASTLRDLVENDQTRDLSKMMTALPIVAFYGTGRLWSEHRLTEGKRVHHQMPTSRLAGYTDCLSSSSSFKGVVAWYEAMMNAIRDPRSSTLPNYMQPVRLIAAVRKATHIVLEPTGWSELDWDFDQKCLVVEHPEYGRLPLSLLSDGIRNMVALVADLSHRCARLNPQFGERAAELTQGILLIDEVDMHLHPGWQQKVIDLMRRAFPSVQMMISTHSPHVLSTVDNESIRLIRIEDGAGVLEKPLLQTRGVESANVLTNVMQIDPIPPVEEAAWVRQYRALIQQQLQDGDLAQHLRAQVEAHFGKDHPVTLECDRIIRLERFKRSLPSKQNSQGDGL